MSFRTAIFESFEPESDDEEDEDEENESEQAEENITGAQAGAQDEEAIRKMKALALKDFPDDESYHAPEEGASDEDDEQLETGVQTSQLRHFVIQACSDHRLVRYDGVLTVYIRPSRSVYRSMCLDLCLLTH
jgi:hypothetical protein